MIVLPALFAVLILCASAAIALASMCWHFSQRVGIEGAPTVCALLAIAFGVAAVGSAVRIVIVCSGWGAG